MGDPCGFSKTEVMCAQLLWWFRFYFCLALPTWPYSRSLGDVADLPGGTESRQLCSRRRKHAEPIAAAFNPLWSIRIYSKTEMHV